MLYAYIFIIRKIFEFVALGPHATKYYTFWCGHVIYQMKGRENPFSEMTMSCPFDPLFDRKPPKITQKWSNSNNFGLKLPENGLKYFSSRYGHMDV